MAASFDDEQPGEQSEEPIDGLGDSSDQMEQIHRSERCLPSHRLYLTDISGRSTLICGRCKKQFFCFNRPTWYCKRCHMAVCEDCAVKKIVRSAEYDNPVFEAAGRGDLAKLQDVLASHVHLIDSPDPNYGNRTPLQYAARRGHSEAIEMLVRSGSEAIDSVNSDGDTPLLEAAFYGHVVVIETLVRLGSKAIDIPTKSGETPLHAATKQSHLEAIETLVRLGSKAIDTPDNQEATPIFSAALDGNVSAIEALVRLGSKAIDTPNVEGWTPLFAAASGGYVSVMETLARLGSKAVDTPDNSGRTPFQIASQASQNFSQSTKLLLALGARDSHTLHFSEDEAVELRYRVYFAQPLVHRLLDIPYVLVDEEIEFGTQAFDDGWMDGGWKDDGNNQAFDQEGEFEAAFDLDFAADF